MENKLLEVINQSGLEKTKSDTLIKEFSNFFEIATEWQNKANEIVVTDVSQVAEMKLAREGRLFLKDKRVGIEKLRKQLKESSLREGQAIDSIARMLTSLIVPIEENLELKEKFKEFEEKRIKDELRAKRLQELKGLEEFVPDSIDLAVLTDIAFNTILQGAKVQMEQKLEAERVAHAEMLAKENRQKLHDQRRSELMEYWNLLEEDVKIMNFGVMSDKYYTGLLADLKVRKSEQEKELQRIREEHEKARKEKEEVEKKLMQEKLKAEKERRLAEQERERLNAELKRKEQEEIERQKAIELERVKAEREAKKLAKAPIKKQLMVWVESFDIADMPVHDQVAVDIVTKFENFKNWAIKQVENI